MIPWWGKLGGLAVAANEVRGAIVFTAGIGDLQANGVHLGQLWLLLLVLVPLVAVPLWKRARIRRRIARRLRGVCAG